jgi:hypothetical protein
MNSWAVSRKKLTWVKVRRNADGNADLRDSRDFADVEEVGIWNWGFGIGDLELGIWK